MHVCIFQMIRCLNDAIVNCVSLMGVVLMYLATYYLLIGVAV